MCDLYLCVCRVSRLSVSWECLRHTHTRLTAFFPGLPGWAGTRKAKPIWILLKQETVSGSGFSWAICKSAPRSRQITMPSPHHSVFFTGRMPFLPPNQQRQSTEGTVCLRHTWCVILSVCMLCVQAIHVLGVLEAYMVCNCVCVYAMCPGYPCPGSARGIHGV